MKKMNIILGCERFGAVRDAFAKRGHNAVSCDLEETSTDGLHYTGDIFDILYRDWDAGIFFPPCTHLAVSGAHRFAAKRANGSQREAIEFFLKLWAAPIAKTGIENPVGIMNSEKYIGEHFPDLLELAKAIGFPFKPTQMIQPWQFGHSEQKTTCLWLRGFQPLCSTNILTPTRFQANGRPQWGNQTPSGQNNLGPSQDRAAIRGRTYAGIAEAMATQWG